ncbi:MAG: ATP-binding protein [Pseudohongiellaceae bacterium]
MAPSKALNPLHRRFGPTFGFSASIVVVVTGVILYFQDPEPLALVIFRVFIVAACLTHSFSTRFIETEFQFHRNNLILLLLLNVWILVLVWHSGFAPHYALGFLAVCMLSTLFLTNENWVKPYTISVFLVTTLCLLLTKQPSIDPIYMLSIQGLGLFICARITNKWLHDMSELEAQNTLMTAIFHESPDALILQTQDGDIRKISAQVPTLFLTDSEERIRELLEIPKAPKKKKSAANQELEFFDNEGGTFWGSLDYRPIAYGDEELVLIRIANVTWKKFLENNLSNALSRANMALEFRRDFMANMSHELRTPMNGVLGMASMLEETDLSDEQRGFTNIIKSSGDLMLEIINNILDFSRLEAGKMEVDKTKINLSEIINECTELLLSEAAEKGLRLSYEISSNIPDALLLDSLRIRQILINLLSNAVKFTQEGEVKVTVEGQYEDKDQFNIAISVSDTGIGISEDKLKAIFKAFSQADASTTRMFGGTGLGLSISNGLANLMGGEITVESTLGKGSRFTLSLAAECAHDHLEMGSDRVAIKFQGQTKERATQTPKVRNSSSLKILLAEDNTINQKVALGMLSKLGYTADLATNGEEAVVQTQAQEYDLVILDLQMPIKGGLEAAKEIRQSSIAQPYLVAFTANVLQEDRIACTEAGMNDFLPKPIRINSLREVTEKVAALSCNQEKP